MNSATCGMFLSRQLSAVGLSSSSPRPPALPGASPKIDRPHVPSSLPTHTRGPAVTHRRAHPAVLALVYLVMLAVPLALVLAAVGSSPALLEKVPPEYRGTVAAFGDGAARLSGSGGGISGFDDDDTTAGAPRTTIESLPLPSQGEWLPRRPEDFVPPAGLTSGLDYHVETTTEGNITHWPCDQEIPVRTFDAPPGSEGDLIWAIETLAGASGLPLRYEGPGTDAQRDADGAISVHHGDHPLFANPEVAGVGGVTAWSHGLVSRGSVTLKPGQITSFPGDPWSRRLTLHELMHAVGVGHAAENRQEIMTTRRPEDFRIDLGPGDQFALVMVGCR